MYTFIMKLSTIHRSKHRKHTTLRIKSKQNKYLLIFYYTKYYTRIYFLIYIM